MKYPQEGHAKELCAVLTDNFATSSPATAIDVEGAGVHWRCIVARGDSSCRISCFDLRGPEYYTSFKRGNDDIATARTSDRPGTVAATSDWLAGGSVSALHNRYPFVDARKRSLSSIQKHSGEACPRLQTMAELKHRGADIYYLHFNDGDRSCAISYYGKNALPDAKFAWDDCELFEYRPSDNSQFAAVLNRWVAEHAQPSQMRREFPTLEIGALADYYESGNPIDGEFIRSWDSIEEFYKEDWCKFSEPVLALIRCMRDAGYDRSLRAGQSLSSLGLSRSRRHGLRRGQPRLWFIFRQTSMDVHADFADTTLTGHPLQFTPVVSQLLASLVECRVD